MCISESPLAKHSLLQIFGPAHWSSTRPKASLCLCNLDYQSALFSVMKGRKNINRGADGDYQDLSDTPGWRYVWAQTSTRSKRDGRKGNVTHLEFKRPVWKHKPPHSLRLHHPFLPSNSQQPFHLRNVLDADSVPVKLLAVEPQNASCCFTGWG